MAVVVDDDDSSSCLVQRQRAEQLRDAPHRIGWRGHSTLWLREAWEFIRQFQHSNNIAVLRILSPVIEDVRLLTPVLACVMPVHTHQCHNDGTRWQVLCHGERDCACVFTSSSRYRHDVQHVIFSSGVTTSICTSLSVYYRIHKNTGACGGGGPTTALLPVLDDDERNNNIVVVVVVVFLCSLAGG